MQSENTEVEENKQITKCLNCGTEFAGKFCPECGQRADTGRFTIKFIFQNLLQGILSNDGGVWFTLKNLFTRPGQMMLDIIDGKRKSYFSPFPMLFLTLSLYIVICTFTGSRVGDFDDEAMSEMKKEYSESLNDTTTYDSKTMLTKKIKYDAAVVLSFYKNHFTAVMALTIPLYILAARISYGRKNRRRYNWGEYCIPVVYATIVVFLYRCIASICFAISKGLFEVLDNWSWIVVLTAFTMCFKKMLEYTIVKTVWRTVVLHVVYFMIVLFLIILFGALFIIVYYDELKIYVS